MHNVATLTSFSIMPTINVYDYIKATTAQNACGYCHSTKWMLLGERAMLAPNQNGEFQIPGPIDKFILLECQGCGFSRFLSLRKMVNDHAQALANHHAQGSNTDRPQESSQEPINDQSEESSKDHAQSEESVKKTKQRSSSRSK